jgi:hypothetical protein
VGGTGKVTSHGISRARKDKYSIFSPISRPQLRKVEWGGGAGSVGIRWEMRKSPSAWGGSWLEAMQGREETTTASRSTNTVSMRVPSETLRSILNKNKGVGWGFKETTMHSAQYSPLKKTWHACLSVYHGKTWTY